MSAHLSPNSTLPPAGAPVVSSALLSPQALAGRIMVIRGQRVLLDADLAQLYEVETKRFNEQIKRHPKRFPHDFMFRLTEEEFESLRPQFATSNRGGRRYPTFRLSAQEQDELLADYLPHTRAVRIPTPSPSVPACRDPLDVPFMHLAVAGRAQVLVSDDRDLLALADEFERAFSCPIVSLDTFARSHLAG